MPTYHIADPTSIDVERGIVRYRPAGLHHRELEHAGWMPEGGPVTIGVTAGASTPNNKIDQTVRKIFATRGIPGEMIG